MPTYLVTGAAGFIGANVCECLLADGHLVVGIDNLNDYYDVRLKDYRLLRLLGRTVPSTAGICGVSIFAQGNRPGSVSAGRFVFQAVDIEDISALDALFCAYRFDAVFNLAARAGVRASIEYPHLFLATNTTGTLNLLECQRKHGVGKHVLASTSSLYNGCPMPFTENLPVNTPLSPYAAAKKAAELMAYSYHKLHGIDVSVLRYFTVFGPAGRPDMAPFRFIKWIDEGRSVELFGDGLQARDFTYVDDVARATVLAVRTLGYEIINIGGGRNPVTLQKVIELIERCLGKRAVVTQQPSHRADARETWADISKAQRLLNWSPQTSVEAGFRSTVDWHVAHREWVGQLEV